MKIEAMNAITNLMKLKPINFWEDLGSQTQRTFVTRLKRLNYCRIPKVRANAKNLLNLIYGVSETMRGIIDSNMNTSNLNEMSILSRRSKLPPRSQRGSMKRQNSKNFEGEVFFKQKMDITDNKKLNSLPPLSPVLNLNLPSPNKNLVANANLN